ncbi:hypothetical protein ACE7GA_01395 [Roseomonas sp. CCTCC AB2023176]|uniref:hypothetical protein n=1 Tax=Roseomonas sp. CCTCC AB2023176 TaxID=3342640 RepID=UPI0035E39F9F
MHRRVAVLTLLLAPLTATAQVNPSSPAPQRPGQAAPPQGANTADPVYRQGQADRAAWEQWLAGLTGQKAAGAAHWAARRSTQNPGSCFDGSQLREWSEGCADARVRLALPDALRRSETQYRLGWNAPITVPTASDNRAPVPPSATAPAAPAAPAAAVAPPRLPPDETACRTDWRRCADNAQLVNNFRDWALVQTRCKRQATDLARYGDPVWPWFSFGSFLRGDDYPQTGIVVAIEPRAQFGNGFGAKVNSRVTCRYDLNRGEVVDVQVTGL